MQALLLRCRPQCVVPCNGVDVRDEQSAVLNRTISPDTLAFTPRVPECLLNTDTSCGLPSPVSRDECSSSDLALPQSPLDRSSRDVAMPPPPVDCNPRHSAVPLLPINRRGESSTSPDEEPQSTMIDGKTFPITSYAVEDTPAKAVRPRFVSFASSPTHSVHQSVFSIVPYEESYDGVHPDDFDFDAFGNKIPRAW